MPPTWVKGRDLVVADVDPLATTLTRLLAEGRRHRVDNDSDRALARVWPCTDSFRWMTSMLHRAGDDFAVELQLSQLHQGCSSKTAARALAETCTGPPVG